MSEQITNVMLKAKLHMGTVTHSELDYEGSCAIDGALLERAGLREFEQIQIYNKTNGARFTTYIIRAEHGSGIISVNGAAARLAAPGDCVIICAYASYPESVCADHKPVLLYLDADNRVFSSAATIPVQAAG